MPHQLVLKFVFNQTLFKLFRGRYAVMTSSNIFERSFEDWLVQIPSPRGKKAVQMPHQLVLKFVFNQTLLKLFRGRYAVMTSSNIFERSF